MNLTMIDMKKKCVFDTGGDKILREERGGIFKGTIHVDCS